MTLHDVILRMESLNTGQFTQELAVLREIRDRVETFAAEYEDGMSQYERNEYGDVVPHEYRDYDEDRNLYGEDAIDIVEWIAGEMQVTP